MDSALPIPSHAGERPDVTVIVVSYNTAHLLDRMFSTLEAARNSLWIQVIVVDNASSDGSADILRTKYPDVQLIENRTNVGFGRANNQAVPWIRGRYILLLNTDAFMAPDTLQTTVDFMDTHSNCGVLGVKLVGRDGALQPSCRYFPTPWNLFLARSGLERFFAGARLVDDMSWDHASVRQCDWVPGCFYLARREVIERVGLFDPRYFLYYEELDHCWAVRRAGWSVVYCPFTQVVHIGGESAKSEGPLTAHGHQISSQQIESELLFFRKHYGGGGLLCALMLALLSDAIIAFKGVMLRFDPNQAAGAAKHSWTVVKVLFMTRLASRATR
jgi:N-acetylglucosaminyl-diphospho-decaprenol L-rhamnosyltransferase